MPGTQSNSSPQDWRSEIADAARATLVEPGVCVVRRAARTAPQVVSRLYPRASYDTPRTMRRVGWSQATRRLNSDCANYYVVERHAEGLVVWSDMHAILGQYALNAR